MKIDVDRIVQAVIVALLLSLVAAAGQTYVEVKMLRHDMERVEGIIDNLVDEVPSPPHRRHQ